MVICHREIDEKNQWIQTRCGDGHDGEAACSIVIIANSVHLAILSDDQIVWPGSCWKGLLKYVEISDVMAGSEVEMFF